MLTQKFILLSYFFFQVRKINFREEKKLAEGTQVGYVKAGLLIWINLTRRKVHTLTEMSKISKLFRKKLQKKKKNQPFPCEGSASLKVISCTSYHRGWERCWTAPCWSPCMWVVSHVFLLLSHPQGLTFLICQPVKGSLILLGNTTGSHHHASVRQTKQIG